MRTIIAGSRTVTNKVALETAIARSGFTITEVISGTACGVDRMGEVFATEHNIIIKRFPANWNKYGKSAGYKRNKVMAEYASASTTQGQLIALWDGQSKGTVHMINLAKEYGLKVFVYCPHNNKEYRR